MKDQRQKNQRNTRSKSAVVGTNERERERDVATGIISHVCRCGNSQPELRATGRTWGQGRERIKTR